MGFLQKSALKKHLSAKPIHMLHPVDSTSAEGARVVLRDGNLVTVSPSELMEEVETQIAQH